MNQHHIAQPQPQVPSSWKQGLPPVPPGYSYPLQPGTLVFSYYDAQAGGVPLQQPHYHNQQIQQQQQQPHHHQGYGQPRSGAPSNGGWWYQAPQDGFKEHMDNHEEWVVGLCGAITQQPKWFCGAAWCGPCAVYKQRSALLMTEENPQNWERYVCCAGLCGPDFLKSKTDGNEEFCLCLEAACCPFLAMHGNRFMVQVHYGVEDTCCDTILIHLHMIFCILAMCLDCRELELASDIAYMAAMGCMAAQHAEQMAVEGYPRGLNITKPRTEPPQQAMQ